MATLNFPPMTGGIEQLSRALARGLAELGHEVRVLGPRFRGAAEHDAGEPYEVVRYRGGRLRHFALTAAVQRELARGETHFLFMQWTGATMLTAARRLSAGPGYMGIVMHGKDLLVAEHGYRSTFVYLGAMQMVLRNADRVFPVSRFTAQLARSRGVADERITLLNPGVDTELFHPRPAATIPKPWRDGDGPYLLTVTRLVPRKGVDTVIESLPRIRQRHPGVRYLVAGEGEDRGRLETLARRHDVADAVRFIGRVDDTILPELYAAVDLMVLVSRQEDDRGDVEGFGLVLLEAQASGTVVIGGNSGGIPDALDPDRTGLLVPPEDPRALATAVQSLLDDPQKMDRMSKEAARRAAQRSWTHVAQRLATALQLD